MLLFYLYHAGMIARIGEDVTAWQLFGQREQRRIIGHVARGEHQTSLWKQKKQVFNQP
jgi:hypothetical protein